MLNTQPSQIVYFIQDSFLDDFFLFGFVSGIVGYLYYVYVSKNDPNNHVSRVAGVYGTLLSGALGGLLAIVFDRNYGISILVGLFNQLIYMALLQSAKSKNFWSAIKEVIIKYLTGGKTV